MEVNGFIVDLGYLDMSVCGLAVCITLELDTYCEKNDVRLGVALRESVVGCYVA